MVFVGSSSDLEDMGLQGTARNVRRADQLNRLQQLLRGLDRPKIGKPRALIAFTGPLAGVSMVAVKSFRGERQRLRTGYNSCKYCYLRGWTVYAGEIEVES
jgi:hypothetical protein